MARRTPNVRRGARSVVVLPRPERAKASVYYDRKTGAFYSTATRAHPRGLKINPEDLMKSPHYAHYFTKGKHGEVRARGQAIPGWKAGKKPPASARKGVFARGEWLEHKPTSRLQFVPQSWIDKGKAGGTGSPIKQLHAAGYTFLNDDDETEDAA